MNGKLFLPLIIFSIILILFSGCASLISEETPGRQFIPESAGDAGLEYAGIVSSELTSWNWFFQSSSEERKAELEKAALTAARKQYGDDAVIKPESSNGNWSPASLLMFFGAAGFVENAELTASVWLPAPPPEPIPEPEPPVNIGIRYRVIPEHEYTSDTEFTTVVYKPLEELAAQLKTDFDSGKLTETQLTKRRSRLPGAGTVFITYGRTELTNAISRWFRFTLTRNGERIFKKRGIEDIPYVYGNDKLWWNDRSYDIDADWTGSLNLIIEDQFQNKFYYYQIVREEYEIPDSE